MGKSDQLKRDGPSWLAAFMVRLLLPPSYREQVLGDLRERYESGIQSLVRRRVPVRVVEPNPKNYRWGRCC